MANGHYDQTGLNYGDQVVSWLSSIAELCATGHVNIGSLPCVKRYENADAKSKWIFAWDRVVLYEASSIMYTDRIYWEPTTAVIM